jgi:hypothetical protein
MPEKRQEDLGPYRGGVFSDLVNRIKLILRLMGDPRVSPLVKIIPIGSLIYLLFPDIAPGPVDDAAIIWFGTYLFVELCPPDVVEEHMAAIRRTIPGQWQESQVASEDDIVEGEFRDEP